MYGYLSYSPRAGTAAALFFTPIPPEIRKSAHFKLFVALLCDHLAVITFTLS